MHEELPAHLVLANAGGSAGQYKVAEAWEAALQQGISLDHLAPIFSPSAAPSQGAVPPLVSLRQALLPYIREAAERLVLQGPLRDHAAREPATGSQNVSSKASAVSAGGAPNPSPQKPAEPREPPPWGRSHVAHVTVVKLRG